MIVPHRPTARPQTRTANSAMSSHRARTSATGGCHPVERLGTRLRGPQVATRQHPPASAALAAETGGRAITGAEGDGHEQHTHGDARRAEDDLPGDVEEIRCHHPRVV